MRRIAATLAVVGALLFSAGSAWADWDDAVAAFAGAIADLCQMETHGVHFSGMTSRGKTIALKLVTCPHV